MRNERHAGRHAVISEAELAGIAERRKQGESIASMAAEFGVSRQALSKRLKEREIVTECPVDIFQNGFLISRMYMDVRKQQVRLENYTDRISQLPFGINQNPEWKQAGEYLEEMFLTGGEAGGPGKVRLPECMETRRQSFSLREAAERCGADGTVPGEGKNVSSGTGTYDTTGTRLYIPEDYQKLSNIPRFEFRRKDLLLGRTDTDGFQLKALSFDHRWFVKSQAVISGVWMDDWKVEVIASRLCRQLNIPCVEQHPCEFLYEGRLYHGVYSANFELDGYTFISFEKLAERSGKSTREEEFIRLDAVGKLHWCAELLAEAGDLPAADTEKYMLDLAVLDCLVGNVDRHTRNFGLFFNSETGKYEIPLTFDNGMGLFEHDYYRDQYETYDEAMRSVYASPYGEDPFDLIQMLDEEFDLRKRYPMLPELDWGDAAVNRFSEEYVRRMKELWQK